MEPEGFEVSVDFGALVFTPLPFDLEPEYRVDRSLGGHPVVSSQLLFAMME